jgi:anti-sigma factor (TIGR02949 family)
MSDTHSPVIPCSEAVRQLWDYLDGSVTPEEHDRVEEHLAFCRRCCGELEFIEHLREFLAQQATDELQPEVVERLERFVEGLGR